MDLRNPVKTMNFLEFIKVKDVPDDADGGWFYSNICQPVQKKVVDALKISGMKNTDVAIENVMLIDFYDIEEEQTETKLFSIKKGEA